MHTNCLRDLCLKPLRHLVFRFHRKAVEDISRDEIAIPTSGDVQLRKIFNVCRQQLKSICQRDVIYGRRSVREKEFPSGCRKRTGSVVLREMWQEKLTKPQYP